MIQTIQSRSRLNTRQLCDRLEMSHGTLLRWRRRSRNGEPLLARPGPKKLGPLPLDQVRRDIQELVHRSKRSAGSGALQAKYTDSISRRDLNQLIINHRRAHNQALRQNFKRITWKEPNLCWAIDATEYGADQMGRKLFIVVATDLCSRHHFEPLPTLSPEGEDVTRHLENLFRRHGRPLLLKRDNGSPFNNASLDALLARSCVIPLNSPVRYPRYNGGIEKAIREFKESLDRCLGPLPQSWDLSVVARSTAAAAHLRNCLPRRILEGRSAAEVYPASNPAHASEIGSATSFSSGSKPARLS